MLSCVQIFATLWTVACQAPLYMDFSRQEYWSGLPFPTPGELPDPRIKLLSPEASMLAGLFLAYLVLNITISRKVVNYVGKFMLSMCINVSMLKAKYSETKHDKIKLKIQNYF